MNRDEIDRRKVDEAINSVGELFSSEPPQRLYHYTTAEGLRGIVESKILWATDVRYLNDPLEFNHGLQEVWESFRKGNPHTYGGLLEEVNDTLERQRQLREVYVTCFCEVDDLLSVGDQVKT